MAIRRIGGRFQPGESGNPGGRPKEVLTHNLAGPRARRALLDLLRATGPGLTVVVLDARGLVLTDPAVDPRSRVAGFDRDADRRLGGVDPADDPPPRVLDPALLASIRASSDAEDQLKAEGWRLVDVGVPMADGRNRSSRVEAYGPGGERLTFLGWCALRSRRAAELLAISSPAT